MIERSWPKAAAALFAAFTAALVSMRRRYVLVVVRGRSMHPTLADGDRMLVRRASGGYEVGQIIVFKTPGVRLDGDPPWRIKRVVALAGDPAPNSVGNVDSLRAVIPLGCLAVQGDNPRSETSERIGYIAVESVLGTANPRYRLPRG
jgi:signal peptidase I